MGRNDATNYVVFAVGGTGTKVAEAMVNLLTLGIPVEVGDRGGQAFGSMNSADSLTLVRVDPDKACRSEDLKQAVVRYQEIREIGGQGRPRGLWSLRLNDLETLHPMESLSGQGKQDQTETLAAKLASDDYGQQQAALRILRLFYRESDLSISLDRGFFQKPFMGSAVIGAMGAVKAKARSQIQDLLKRMKGQPLRAFVVGSMYGGTGAAGIPVISKIVRTFARNNGHEEDWRVAGCLLAPYFHPPEPPISEIDWGGEWTPNTKETLDDFLKRTNRSEDEYLEDLVQRNRGKNLAGPGEYFNSQELRQIARGYYAKPDEIERRAYASWTYYQRRGEELFDDLYLLGLRTPTRYGEVTLDRQDYPEQSRFSGRIHWSNGGRNQVSPLHAVEFAAAGLGLRFFSSSEAYQGGTKLLGVHHHESRVGDALCWADLAMHPSVRADRWLYAALVGFNWVHYNLTRHVPTRAAFENSKNSFPALHRFINPEHYESFHHDLRALTQRLAEALLLTVRALGWEEEKTLEVMRLWSRKPMTFGKVGGVFSQRAASYEFLDWRLERLDAESLGKEVPSSDLADEQRGLSTEAKGYHPSGIAYLQAVWHYAASHFTQLKAQHTGD